MRYFRQWSAPPRTKWAMCRGWRPVMSSRGHDRRCSTEMAPRTRSNDAMPSSLPRGPAAPVGPTWRTEPAPSRHRHTRVEAHMGTYTDMSMVSAPRLRPAARADVLDAAQRVLLVHFVFGTDENLPNGLWACPGGGIELPKSLADGLRREVSEELGLTVGDVGPPIWRKEHVFPMRRRLGRSARHVLPGGSRHIRPVPDTLGCRATRGESE
jgi:8-oxo-dGTP pyrophosphatase MutT (NUDIX family)